MQGSPVMSLSPSSPSFNSYSSANFAEIAARVVEEFRQQESNRSLDSDLFSWEPHDEENQQDLINNHHHNNNKEEEGEEEEEEEEEFEFAVVCNEKQDCPSVTADDIFFNGQIKPFYPLFDTSLLLSKDNSDYGDDDVITRPPPPPSKVRSPLGKLMSEERETDVSLSCSSSEADDLDSLQPGTYCVWTPPPPKASSKESPARCKKSNSTGSSKRWNKIRELLLLHRSNSDGKDTFVFLTPPPHNNNNNNSKKNNKKKASSNNNNNNNNNNNKAVDQIQYHYVKNRSSSVKQEEGEEEEEDYNKRSLLPYNRRHDLVAFFSNVHGFPKR